MVPLPFLQAKRLSNRIELDSSYQSRRCFKYMFKNRDKERAIGLNKELELGFEMRIIL